jgi:Tfp pilus assembly major pilin PilA
MNSRTSLSSGASAAGRERMMIATMETMGEKWAYPRPRRRRACLRLRCDDGKRGFTAVEITMVAAIIVILTLVALPLYRKRVEESRKTGALDEMSSLAKAEELAFAETGYYFRLNDLDNTTQYTTDTTKMNAGIDVPIACWNRILTSGTPSERDRLATSPSRWNGPYISFRKFAYLDEMEKTFDPNMFRDGGTNNNGPILLLNLGNSGGDKGDDRYPLDPWGNPYLFFGAGDGRDGQMIPNDARFISQKRCAIYSLGPDGMPGNMAPPTDNKSYWRQEDNSTGVLGTGDDLVYVF